MAVIILLVWISSFFLGMAVGLDMARKRDLKNEKPKDKKPEDRKDGTFQI